MKKGDRVMIYEDPITRRLPEGEAELITMWSECDEGDDVLECRMVRFIGDEDEGCCLRTIRIDPPSAI